MFSTEPMADGLKGEPARKTIGAAEILQFQYQVWEFKRATARVEDGNRCWRSTPAAAEVPDAECPWLGTRCSLRKCRQRSQRSWHRLCVYSACTGREMLHFRRTDGRAMAGQWRVIQAAGMNSESKERIVDDQANQKNGDTHLPQGPAVTRNVELAHSYHLLETLV